MNKKIILVAFFSTVFVIGIIVLFSIRESEERKNSASEVNFQNSRISDMEKMPSNTMKKYSDQSGFTFNSPDNIKIEKKENDSLYADLILSSSEVNGSIAFTVSDSKYDSLEDWKNNNLENLTGLLINESDLGSLSGVSFNNKDKITLIAIDQGIEFKMVVVYKDHKKYWENVYKSIRDSFAFTSPSTSQSTNTNSEAPSEEVSFEGEEVIE